MTRHGRAIIVHLAARRRSAANALRGGWLGVAMAAAGLGGFGGGFGGGGGGDDDTASGGGGSDDEATTSRENQRVCFPEPLVATEGVLVESFEAGEPLRGDDGGYFSVAKPPTPYATCHLQAGEPLLGDDGGYFSVARPPIPYVPRHL